MGPVYIDASEIATGKGRGDFTFLLQKRDDEAAIV
jgi:hypothetical protein